MFEIGEKVVVEYQFYDKDKKDYITILEEIDEITNIIQGDKIYKDQIKLKNHTSLRFDLEGFLITRASNCMVYLNHTKDCEIPKILENQFVRQAKSFLEETELTFEQSVKIMNILKGER